MFKDVRTPLQHFLSLSCLCEGSEYSHQEYRHVPFVLLPVPLNSILQLCRPPKEQWMFLFSTAGSLATAASSSLCPVWIAEWVITSLPVWEVLRSDTLQSFVAQLTSLSCDLQYSTPWRRSWLINLRYPLCCGSWHTSKCITCDRYLVKWGTLFSPLPSVPESNKNRAAP